MDESHDQQPPEHAADSADRRPGTPAEEPEWKRRRRLAEIFGDVLPTTTRDERDPAGGRAQESGQDAWLRAQVPPHHGG